MLNGFLSRQICSIKQANYCRTSSVFQNILGIGSQIQIRHISREADKNGSKENECTTPRQYRPTANDPYRIKRPFLELKSILESNAKPAIDCRVGNMKDPCTERSKEKEAPKPKPIPSRPINWKPYLLLLAFVFGTSGLLYRAYEQRMRDYFLVNSKANWTARKILKKPPKVYQLPKKTQYLIIGAGTAGVAAYKAIMEHDEKAMVLFISEEDSLPYHRPELSKGLWTNPEVDSEKLSFMDGKKEKSCFYFPPTKFMDAKEFSLLKEGPAVSIATGWPINRVNAEEHKVYTSSNLGDTSIEYKKCLIATGSRAARLRFLDNATDEVNNRICSLRTVRDFETAIVRVRNATNTVIVGDGPLALELAYSLIHLKDYADLDEDLKVTLVMPGNGILSSVIPDYLAQWAAEFVKAEGIKVIPRTEVLDCYMADRKLKMYLSSGQELPADYVFLAIGGVPRTEIAKSSFLEVDKERGGFLVNTELMARTDLYVAGDCASLYDIYNDRIRYDHYKSAHETGCLAGENMTGGMKAFTLPPCYTLKFGKNILLQSIGETSSKLDTVGVFTTCTVDKTTDTPDKRPPQPVGEEPCFKRTDEYKKKFQKGVVIYLRDHMVVGLALWNLGNKEKIAVEILSEKPKHEDIEAIVEKLQIHEKDCCSDC